MINILSLTASDLPPNYRAYALGSGKPVLDAFADLPAVYPALRSISLAGLPAAFAMIERVEIEMRKTDLTMMWNDRLKMFLGLCTLKAMALYGHRAKGIKRAIPHPAFNRGEVYDIQGYVHIPHARIGADVGAATDDVDQAAI